VRRVRWQGKEYLRLRSLPRSPAPVRPDSEANDAHATGSFNPFLSPAAAAANVLAPTPSHNTTQHILARISLREGLLRAVP
jgi:hypothetical protein